MSAWDIVLPHRLLINRSLRKASADLRSRINDYEMEYELEIERCAAEIEQAKADKDKDFDKVTSSLIDELSKDTDLFEKVRAGLLEYVDLFLRRQCLYKVQKAKRLEKQALVEYRNFLTAQMRLIGEEIDILEARKDKLVAQAKVDDIKELIGLSECEVAVNDNDDAISLLTKVSELIFACDVSDRLIIQALQKLRSVLQERVDLLPVIQYISWTIQQKKLLSAQLKGDRDKTIGDVKEKTDELLEISESIDSLNRSLDEQARTVRAYWVVPIAQLNIQISFLYRKLNGIFAEVKEIGEHIERMKSVGSDDSFTWDRLWREKNDLKEQIPQVKGKIESLKSERQQWFTRQQMLYSLCKRNNVCLISDGKAEASDEYRIIDTRLTELLQIEKEANQREEERFEQESALIQQIKKAKIDELSAKIASTEATQAEKSAALSQASKQLSNSKSRDARFFLLKIFSETEEVSQAKQAKQIVAIQKKITDNQLIALKSELAKVTEDFENQLVTCRPKPYRPTLAEIEEREKLEVRRTELLDKQSQKKSTNKERRHDGTN
jgi:hypothetical protein